TSRERCDSRYRRSSRWPSQVTPAQCESSCPRKRASSKHASGNRARRCITQRPAATGSPAFAGDDGRGVIFRTSKLRPVRALQPEHLARVVRRRHLEAELLDQAPRLRHLLGVAFGELAAADEQAVFEANA